MPSLTLLFKWFKTTFTYLSSLSTGATDLNGRKDGDDTMGMYSSTTSVCKMSENFLLILNS